MQALRPVVSTRVLRQLARAAGVLLGVSLLAFASFDLAPGDPLAGMRPDPRITPGAVAALRDQYGLNRPLLERYGRWVGSVARGDLGYSTAYGPPISPIAPLLARRAVNSSLLVGTALVATWMLAWPLGVWTAARSQTLDGRLQAGMTSALQAIPDLLIAVTLLLFAEIRARALLKEAGFTQSRDRTLVDTTGAAVAFSMLVAAGNEPLTAMGTIIQDDLRQIGISVQIVPLEFGALLKRVLETHDDDACLLRLAGGDLAGGDVDPNPEMNLWLSSGPTEVPLVSPNIVVAAKRGLGNFRPAILEHDTLWNVEQLFWLTASLGGAE